MNSYQQTTKNLQTGLTLIEAMIALVILAIVAALAGPSFIVELEHRRAESAAESIYQVLRQARTAALQTSTDVYVLIDVGTTWNVWLSPTNPCASRVPTGNCLLNGILSSGSNHPWTTLSVEPGNLDALKVTYRTGSFENSTDPTNSNPHNLKISTPSGFELHVHASREGQLRICTPSGAGRYPQC